MKITATFIDEISHDIPHQNWGEEEWDLDFQAMRAAGIDTVVVIRCGWKRWMTYPSKILHHEQGCFMPSTDLMALFLKLAERYSMKLFCGTYDAGDWWWSTGSRDPKPEIELMRRVNDEFYELYGASPAFGGWYLSSEISGNNPVVIGLYQELSQHLKKISGNLPILISPGIKGAKAYDIDMKKIGKTIPIEQHESYWDANMRNLQNCVDIIAFQDGHVEIELLGDFLRVNKKLCDRYGITCWTNTESFDRDMPIDFLPIKWDKMWQKLQAAELAGITNSMTFEFSHFMSPNSMYISAHNLYNRYCEYAGLSARSKNFQNCI